MGRLIQAVESTTGKFEIGEDTGVLTFKDSPDFEAAGDVDEDDSVIATGVGDNMYKVSIKANGGPAYHVTVEVTNADEPGTVSLDKPRPQVGRPIGATGFGDPDGPSDESILWYSGPAMEGPWTSLDHTTHSYTPQPDDSGNYLRVVYTYSDHFGPGKTAEAVSDLTVEDKTLSNAPPKFAGDDADTSGTEAGAGFQVSRTTKEGAAAGTNIGDPSPPRTLTTTCSAT